MLNNNNNNNNFLINLVIFLLLVTIEILLDFIIGSFLVQKIVIIPISIFAYLLSKQIKEWKKYRKNNCNQ